MEKDMTRQLEGWQNFNYMLDSYNIFTLLGHLFEWDSFPVKEPRNSFSFLSYYPQLSFFYISGIRSLEHMTSNKSNASAVFYINNNLRFVRWDRQMYIIEIRFYIENNIYQINIVFRHNHNEAIRIILNFIKTQPRYI